MARVRPCLWKAESHTGQLPGSPFLLHPLTSPPTLAGVTLSRQGWGRTLLTCQVPTAPPNLPFLLLSLFLGQLCRLPAALWGGQQPQCQAARGWWSHRVPASSASAPTNTSLYPTSCDRDRKLSCRRLREEFKPLGTSHNSSLRALAGALVASTGGTD